MKTVKDKLSEAGAIIAETMKVFNGEVVYEVRTKCGQRKYMTMNYIEDVFLKEFYCGK